MTFTISNLQLESHHDQDLFGSSDPYVVFQRDRMIGHKTLLKTPTAKGGGKRVAWQETFHLEKASSGDEVQVQAWDKDMGSDDSLGMGGFSLTPGQQQITLINKDGKPVGMVSFVVDDGSGMGGGQMGGQMGGNGGQVYNPGMQQGGQY